MAVAVRAFCIAVIASGVAILAGAFLAAVRADEARIYTAGDSHCVALAQVAGLPSVARNGAFTSELPLQLEKLPENTKVIICSGTNDATRNLRFFEAYVRAAIMVAELRRLTLIWIGPSRTTLWWDRYSDQADTFLALAVPNYVSLRAIDFPDNERSGFHLTPEGYARLWRIVRGNERP